MGIRTRWLCILALDDDYGVSSLSGRFITSESRYHTNYEVQLKEMRDEEWQMNIRIGRWMDGKCIWKGAYTALTGVHTELGDIMAYGMEIVHLLSGCCVA
jgi:hypothetical protein